MTTGTSEASASCHTEMRLLDCETATSGDGLQEEEGARKEHGGLAAVKRGHKMESRGGKATWRANGCSSQGRCPCSFRCCGVGGDGVYSLWGERQHIVGEKTKCNGTLAAPRCTAHPTLVNAESMLCMCLLCMLSVLSLLSELCGVPQKKQSPYFGLLSDEGGEDDDDDGDGEDESVYTTN